MYNLYSHDMLKNMLRDHMNFIICYYVQKLSIVYRFDLILHPNTLSTIN